MNVIKKSIWLVFILVVGALAGCSSGEDMNKFASEDLGYMRLPNGLIVRGTILHRPGLGEHDHYVYAIVAQDQVSSQYPAPSGNFSKSQFVKSVEDKGTTQAGEKTLHGFVFRTGAFEKDQFFYYEERDGRPVTGVSMNTTQSAGKSSYNQAIVTLVDGAQKP